jgi:hypothetical protein
LVQTEGPANPGASSGPRRLSTPNLMCNPDKPGNHNFPEQVSSGFVLRCASISWCLTFWHS